MLLMKLIITINPFITTKDREMIKRRYGKSRVFEEHREFIRANGEFVRYGTQNNIRTEVYKCNGKEIAFCTRVHRNDKVLKAGS